MKKLILFFGLLTSLLLLACAEDEYGFDLNMEVLSVPKDSVCRKKVLVGGSRYKLRFRVHNYWGEPISRLSLKTFDAQRGDVVALDTAFLSREANFDYTYVAPSFQGDSVKLDFYLSVTDGRGHSASYNYLDKYLVVQPRTAMP